MKAQDKIKKLLELSERKDTINEAIDHAEMARTQVLAALDALHEIDENGSAVGGALRASIPDLHRARRILSRMRGDVNRAIANVARSKTT